MKYFFCERSFKLLIVLQLFTFFGARTKLFAQTVVVPAKDTVAILPAPKPKVAVVVPKADNFIQRFDDRTIVSLALNRTPEATPVMSFLSRNLMYGNIGVPAGLLIGGIITKDRNMRENAGYVASSTAITFVATYLIKKLVGRPRPFIRNLKIVPVYIPGESSFPSGHTSTSFSTAMALSRAYPKWYVIAPSFLWAGATGYSRMYLGVHYPTDVLGGAVLGSGTALALKPAF
ncbi:phosphatase PAP2 family protein [Mucilaginibacter gilvus]|uniref:Phosphatase PAP2 family protein n=1 Tax=Mucilaginibacter gilvus TaxID=2305909 RepID=A0A3S3Z031_9SPHI|nr:phosphatase PAP2 family protein [Mucilaginibacter gilvus]RWY49978.1 phosphatase PAP2 family protein [Mucilaginibacter gilvus]